VDGLEWSDVTAQTMPTLATLSGQGAPGSLVLPDTGAAGDAACPADGWLTLGTGAPSTGGRELSTPRGSDPLSTAPQPGCASLPATPLTRGPYTIPDYSSYRAANAGAAARPEFGALAAAVHEAGGCVAASGAGAMLAAADARGRVADYLGSADTLAAADLAACPLTLVDLGGYRSVETSADTRYPPPVSRAAVFSALDAQIAALLPQLPTDSALLVAGLDDADPAAPRLHALLATGQSADGSPFTPGRRLRSATTRTDGVVQDIDLTPSLLRWAGLNGTQIAAAGPRPFAGALITLGTPAPDGDGAAVLAASRLDTADVVRRDTGGAFDAWLLHAVLILALAGCAVCAAVAATARLRTSRARRPLLLALAAWASVLGAVFPAAFLAGLDDWAAAADPAQRLYGLTAALAVLLGLIVHAVCRFGRLRERPLAPAGILALLTLAVIAGDVSSGSRLERQTPFGYPFVTAERFFGIGDRAIGVYCAAAVIGAVFAAGLVLPRPAADVAAAGGRDAASAGARAGAGGAGQALVDRRFALLAVGLIGLLALTVCGLPAWGDRPSGTIALAPGFALLALLVTRPRFSRGGLPVAAALATVLVLTCVLGWIVDGAGSQLPEAALLFTVPLAVATGALALLRATPRTAVATRSAATASTSAAAPAAVTAAGAVTAAAAPRGSVRGPVTLRMQDQRGGADEA
jgi:hypothetical protein